MFSEALADKAMTNPLWRRRTALGRKVASNLSVQDCIDNLDQTLDEFLRECNEELM